MTVGGHVDGDVVDGDAEVRAVVEVEATQEVLVRFAAAAVLGDDDARHRLQQLTGTEDGPLLQICVAGDPLLRRISDAQHVRSTVRDLDLVINLEPGVVLLLLFLLLLVTLLRVLGRRRLRGLRSGHGAHADQGQGQKQGPGSAR
jgi:hypothetical protein